MEDFRIDIMVGKGAGATSHPARPRAVHAGRRDHPLGAAAEPAARPLRLHRAPRVLRRRPSSSRCSRARPRMLGLDDRPPARSPRSPGAAAARPASPTGCCAACATTRSCTAAGARRSTAVRAALDLYDVDALGLDRLDRAVHADASSTPVRRRPGRAQHARRLGGRGGRDDRVGRRAVPRAHRAASPARRAAGSRRRRRGAHFGLPQRAPERAATLPIDDL